MGEMITMITGITHRSGGMRVNLKQCDGNSPKTKEKAGKSITLLPYEVVLKESTK
jgi:hypothetical protein